jgi:hypothetical protein
MTASTTTSRADRSLRARAIRLVEQFHWLHTSLGLLGNLMFFVGSVLFLWEASKLAGIWLFIVGSLGMLLGSIGDKVTQIEDDDG